VKDNAKQNGSGGRLRLALLAVSAAAFLLVPAAAASAVTLTTNIEGTGDGKVITSTDPFYEELQSTPPIECEYIAPGPKTGTCSAEAANTGANVARLVAEPFAGSEFKEWVLTSGSAADGCGAGELECGVFTFGATPITVKAVFVAKPNVHITIEGSGSGTVVSQSGELSGTPPINCSWNGATQSGTCDNINGTAFGGALEGVGVKQAAAPGSEFVEWIVEEGEPGGADCFPGEEACTVYFPEPEIKIKAVFAALPTFALNLTTSGPGSGSFECDSGSGAGACQAEYLAGTEVEVIATPDTGSDPAILSGTGSAAACAVSPCTFEMTEESSVNAEFNLSTYTLTTEAFGAGEVTAPGITCTEAGNGGAECEATFAYGTNVVVTATPAALNSVGSITGSGSAKEQCGTPTPEAPVTCEFEIKAGSGVSAEFVAAESIESKSANVHGEVPQNTTLEFTEDEEGNTCADVDLGIFQANAQEDVTYAKTCGLIVTATGAENVLSAEDESETSTGHLVNSGYELTQPLETQAEGLPGLLFPGEGGGTLASLESVVDLLTYGGPVNSDNVTLEFSQLINEHDPLYTGEYAKQITLTLEQTAL